MSWYDFKYLYDLNLKKQSSPFAHWNDLKYLYGLNLKKQSSPFCPLKMRVQLLQKNIGICFKYEPVWKYYLIWQQFQAIQEKQFPSECSHDSWSIK